MEEQRKRKYGPSTVATLKVVRESELGAFLDAETGNTNDDILLHKNQQTHPVNIGDEVEVFLYLDPKRKLTASMRVPKMREGQIARLKVINTSRDGAFLDVGAERGIFMPYAGMRGRPQIGEVVATGEGRILESGKMMPLTVKVGDRVNTGDVVVVLEAMKMQNNIEAEQSGTVTAIKVNPGDSVMEGSVLLTIG